MQRRPLPSQARIQSLLSYSPDTGEFTWRDSAIGSVRAHCAGAVGCGECRIRSRSDCPLRRV